MTDNGGTRTEKNNPRVERQSRLGKPRVNYSLGPYNKHNDKEQWIRITEGCPNQCPYCYEPKVMKVFGVPEIIRNNVKIMDMNLIWKPDAWDLLFNLPTKLNGKKVTYELVCGIDYRFLRPELADVLKKRNFVKPRIAWDWEYKEQVRIKKAIDMLIKAGYKSKDIMIFMICNWKIPYDVNCKKLDLCKIWNVKAADCWFDNQTSPNIQPIHWKPEEIKSFRKKVRLHNQLVNFGVDPNETKQPSS